MTWIANRRSALTVLLLTAAVGVCVVLSGVAAAKTGPAAAAACEAKPAQSAAEAEQKRTVQLPQPVTHFDVELLAFPEPAAAEKTEAPEETAQTEEPEAEEAEPELLPVLAQYALPEGEKAVSGKEETHVPENLAACTADAAIPDDLERLDSFIATAYFVTGRTSTGTETTVGRTLAVNPGVVPYGTHVWMFLDDGTFVGDFIAEDTGSNMQAHPHVIDVYMGADSRQECLLWGAQHVTLYTSPLETAE